MCNGLLVFHGQHGVQNADGSICKEEIGALVVTMWMIFNVFTFHKVACITLSQNKS